jgi:hypothetical protein
MYYTDENDGAASKRKTLAVLLLLLITALVLSYLWAYGLSDALAAGLLMSPVGPDSDPRPVEMAQTFGVIMALFLFGAGMLKWTSSRQLKRIDAMNRE